MRCRILVLASLVQIIFCIMFVLFLFFSNSPKTYAFSNNLLQTLPTTPAPTPTPFLGPIFYGRNYILKIFDHNLPRGGFGEDGNNDVVHYDGSLHIAVTPTPFGDPYVPGVYGYDQHLGIDYNLRYQPVLAAASGTVYSAGWADPGDHTKGLGLHLILEHNESYRTYYGHLSSLVYQTGEVVEVEPLNSPDRNRILGISGSTGHVLGSCDMEETPLCGAHLHLETRYNYNGVWTVVNPYGWIGTGTDPWVEPGGGPTSYDLWAVYPAISSGQYPGAASTPLPTPYLNDSRLNLDDSSELFHVYQNCWLEQADPEGYYGGYHWTEMNQTPIPIETPPAPDSVCQVSWEIPDFDGLFGGEYDVFVYVPEFATSLSANYDVVSASGTDYSQAVVVQAAYPLGTPTLTPPAFGGQHTAYIGRYQLDMNGGESIVLGNAGLEMTDGQLVVADMVSLIPANPNHENIYLSTNYAGSLSNQGTPVPFDKQDVLLYNTNLNQWSLVFDGSALGLGGNLDALHVLPDGSFLLSPGLGLPWTITMTVNLTPMPVAVEDWDIVRFVPNAGDPTTGSFFPYFGGAAHGLDTPLYEGIDAIAFAPPPDNRLLLSTTGEYNIFPLPTGDGKDLLAFQLTPVPTGTPEWGVYLDGSAVQLEAGTENISGATVMENGLIYLVPWGDFQSGGMEGTNSDIFFCVPDATAGFPLGCAYDLFGRYWSGPGHQITGQIDAISLLLSPGSLENLLINGSFESGFLGWINEPNQNCEEWEPTSEEVFDGQYSAKAYIVFSNGECDGFDEHLKSSTIHVEAGKKYRISFWGKAGYGATPEARVSGTMQFNNGALLIGLLEHDQTSWQLFSTGEFICPVPEATDFQVSFALQFIDDGASTGTFFIDQVVVEEQTGTCPSQ